MGATALFVVSYRFQADLIHVNEEKRLRNMYHYFLKTIDLKKNMAMSLAYLVAKNSDVAEAFAKRDRRRLIDLFPAISFLRLHALDKFGERMGAVRHTINKAWETGIGVGGLESGVFGFGIRSVVPVYYESKQVGTVEFGFSFEEPLLEEFKKNYRSDLTVYVEKDPGVNRPKVFASTLTQCLLKPELFSQSFNSGDVVFHTTRCEGRDVAIITGPIRDFSSNIVAVVEIRVDRTHTLALLRQYGTIAVMIGLAGLILSMCFVWFISVIYTKMCFVWFISVIYTKRIGKVVEASEEIAAGHRDTRIAIESADELGVMAQSINKMLRSLEESRRKIKDYAENLELMVEQRTRSLKESEQTYRTLVENVPLIVYLVMADRTAVFLNRFGEQMVGMALQDLSGHHEALADHIHPHDRSRVLTHFEECLNQGKEFHEEYRMVHKDGHTVYVVDHAVPVFDRNNELQRMDGIVLDITARKELQEKIVQAEELETLSEVSARLAHEIRNPLTSIGGLTRRLLKSFESSDPRRKKGELIVQEVEKLESILRMMTAYIEPKSIQLRPCDLNEIVSKAIQKVNSEFRDKNFSVKADLDDSLHEIKLDCDLFERVLINLMENAFYRMNQKGVVEVATGRNSEYAAMTMAYEVPFISDDDIEHFFYPFVTDYPFPKRILDRDIMDVPICKVLIHKHGGIVNVTKEKDNIVKITISLPYK
jgi:PAS domain S-box-containing protein